MKKGLKEPHIIKIRMAMAERKVSKAQLAHFSGVTEATIHHWLSGSGVPGVYSSLKIADLLGFGSVEELFG